MTAEKLVGYSKINSPSSLPISEMLWNYEEVLALAKGARNEALKEACKVLIKYIKRWGYGSRLGYGVACQLQNCLEEIHALKSGEEK